MKEYSVVFQQDGYPMWRRTYANSSDQEAVWDAAIAELEDATDMSNMLANPRAVLWNFALKGLLGEMRKGVTTIARSGQFKAVLYEGTEWP